jgi:phosphohistidine phosphatase
MNLFLIRHGEAKAKKMLQSDFERPLNKTGIDEAKKLNLYLQNRDFNADLYCSDALRTQQTLAILNVFKEKNQIFEHRLYHASLESLLRFIWQQKNTNDLIIVGHNNGLSELIHYFTPQTSCLPTAGFVEITFDCTQWAETSKEMGKIVQQNF